MSPSIAAQMRILRTMAGIVRCARGRRAPFVSRCDGYTCIERDDKNKTEINSEAFVFV